jgi:hypothetical protein
MSFAGNTSYAISWNHKQKNLRINQVNKAILHISTAYSLLYKLSKYYYYYFHSITAQMQKGHWLSRPPTIKLNRIKQIQLQLIQSDKKPGKMHNTDIAPFTHNSNYICFKWSFSDNSDQQERQGDKKTDITYDKLQVLSQQACP